MNYNYFKAHEYDRSQTVVSLLKKAMAANKNKIALAYKERRITYGELDILSDKIAQFLKNHGAGKEKVVSILLSRSEMMIVAAIGALKSGCAYQPLDPSYPDDRLNFMVEDSEAVALITEDGLRQRLPNFKGTVLDINEVENLAESEVEILTEPQDLFILLYTSGSTGIPKGVMLEHKNLVAFIDWYTRYYSLNSESRVAAYASFGFDASMMDTYPILCAGGQLHIIAEEMRMDFPKLHKYFEENKITHSFMTTQVGRQYGRMYPESASLNHLSVGGEKLVPVDPPKYNFYNAYGPTECTIFSTIFKVDKRYKNVPIGYPLENLRLYIVDENGAQVENGVEGELWISGPQVARGYLNRPEKTTEVFIKNPFSDDPDFEKVYRTGDIVKGCDDGKIEFVGRRDGQVKIRGFRIELPEIEEVIRRFEDVQDATVAAFDKPAGGKYIVGYVVSDKKIDVDALHKFIAKTKPPYMVPAFTLQIEKIPLNQNQKVDKKQLPIPEYKMEDYEAPATKTEKFICEKMARALGLEGIGVNDDFFQIGGDSLTTIMLITECAHPGVNISSIYQYRTPRNLAAYCESLDKVDDLEEIRKKDSDAMKKSFPLTPAQMVNLQMQLDDPDAVSCNIPRFFVFNDDIDLEKMKDAVNKVMAHHPALRTKFFVDESGEYRQVYDEKLFTPIEITNLSDAEFDELKSKLVKTFHILDGECIWRGGIYNTPSAKFLFLDFHHIMMDGFSEQLILNEIFDCYQDTNHKLPPDFYFYLLENILSEKETQERKEAAAYCDKIFRSSNSLREEEMPLKPDHEVTKMSGAVKMFPLAIPKEKLRGNVAYLTACALAVAAFNNSNRAVIMCTHYGRSDSLSLSSVGFFINRYPIFLVKEDDDTPETLIAKVQEQVSFADAHINYSYVKDNLKNQENLVRFIYHKDITKIGNFEKLIKKWMMLDSNNSAITDSLFGVSVFDNSTADSKFNFFGANADKYFIFLVRYAGNAYDETSMLKFRDLYFDAAKYLAGEK